MQLNSILTTLFLLVSIGTVLAAPQFPLPAGQCQWTSSIVPCTLMARISYEADDSCVGHCNMAYDSSYPCQCNTGCASRGDCCSDYYFKCPSAFISDQEIFDISSQIWNADVNRLTVGLDWQGTTTDGSKEDQAPGHLCTVIPPEIDTNPLYTTLQGLFYDMCPAKEGDMSSDNIDAFLTQVTSTKSMQLVKNFLAFKSLAPSDPVAFQALLKDMWFTEYFRDNAKTFLSSGAQHVLLGEIRSNNSTIGGLHNWVRFCTQEISNEALNYLGYVARKDLGSGVWLIRNPFKWCTAGYKGHVSFFIGTSPAFDLSIFTLCFYARPNATCDVRLNDIAVPIQTFTKDDNGTIYVATAYPEF